MPNRPAPLDRGTGRTAGCFRPSGAGVQPLPACCFLLPAKQPSVSGLLASAGCGLGGMCLPSRSDALRSRRLMRCRFGSRRGCRGRRKDRRRDHHRRRKAKTDQGMKACHIHHSIESASGADGTIGMSRRSLGREGAGGMAPPWTPSFYPRPPNRGMAAT